MNLPIKHDDIRIPIYPFLIFLGILISSLSLVFLGTVSWGFLPFITGMGIAISSFIVFNPVLTIKSNKPKMLTENEERELEADVFSDYDNFIERLDAELEPVKEIVIVPKAIELIPVKERLNPNQVAVAVAKNHIICKGCKGRGHNYGWDCPTYRTLIYTY